jgi:hypothetical protein
VTENTFLTVVWDSYNVVTLTASMTDNSSQLCLSTGNSRFKCLAHEDIPLINSLSQSQNEESVNRNTDSKVQSDLMIEDVPISEDSIMMKM